MIIVSDTSPLNYLVLIGHIDVLERLFEQVIIPQAVFNEMQHEKTPAEVKAWINTAPPWLEVQQADFAWFTPSKRIGNGEREAIALAKELHAPILIDDRDGTTEARRNSLATISTLTLLDRAARRNLVDLRQAIGLLRGTTFRLPPAEKIKEILERDAQRNQRLGLESQRDHETAQEDHDIERD